MPKGVTIYTRKKAEFNCKNNYKYSKLANFWQNIIGKFNFRLLVIMSSTCLKNF